MTGRDREKDTYDRFQRRDRERFGDNEHGSIRGNDSVRSDLVDLTVFLFTQTPKAICVSQVPGGKQTWLPKSQIEFVTLDGDLIELALPERLAKEKGLI